MLKKILIASLFSLLPWAFAFGETSDLAKKVKEKAFEVYGENCFFEGPETIDQSEVDEYELADGKLLFVLCAETAYSRFHVAFYQSPSDGLVPLPIAVPVYDIEGLTEDSARYEAVNLVGYSTESFLEDYSFDEESLVLTTSGFGSGGGDTGTVGEWIFNDNGNFQLKSYEVDVTRDLQFDPETIVEFK